MEIVARILLIVFAIMTINSGVKYPLEKLTMYKKYDITYQPSWFVILFAFFGVFMLLFIKQIRQFRKIYYINNRIKLYEEWGIYEGVSQEILPEEIRDMTYDDYMNDKRYLKLKKLQRKSKRYVNRF